ncbi:sugar kinase [Clostridium paridis]|uniref:Sugar kinase n=1 Tax=Clostridium paridis TaxID=2803863 RepID=A0A937FJN2_9CLOT|nr:sugar kinase [Clostridium paridis]MBL4933737.1 sugar kinase [Clostridium paridis]
MERFLAFGEVLIRYTNKDNNIYSNGNLVEYFYGGSEANIAATLSGLGVETSILSAIPKNNMCDDIVRHFKGLGVNTKYILRSGEKMGFYFTERGTGVRGDSVIYDRKNSAFSKLTVEEIDPQEVLKDITWFHFSGITAAVSEGVREILKKLVLKAKDNKITISMDLNYRSKMWEIKEAKDFLSEIAPYVDICFGIEPIKGSDDDYDLFNRDEASAQDIEDRMKLLKDRYKFKYIFHTERKNDSENSNSYKAYAYSDKLYESKTLKTNMIERVGSGDAFVSGIIYGLINNYSLKETIDFGVASATLKCTIKGDHMIVSESSIKEIGNMKIAINR